MRQEVSFQQRTDRLHFGCCVQTRLYGSRVEAGRFLLLQSKLQVAEAGAWVLVAGVARRKSYKFLIVKP